jgi:hypothetical protein
MADQQAKAYINLKGVLRSLTYLCDMDSEAAKIIEKADITVQFRVKNGPTARLIFRNGKCSFEDGEGKSDIKLYFSSPEKFNKMIEGKGMPSIRKGFTKLGFLLKDFSNLTKRMEYYLKPAPDTVQDERFKEINTLLTFYTAFNSLAEICMHDPVGKKVIEKACSGQLCACIENTPHAVRLKIDKGYAKIIGESDGSPEFYLTFRDVVKTNEVLNGISDFITAVGLGDVKMKGFIPVMMSVQHLVPLLSVYLK